MCYYLNYVCMFISWEFIVSKDKYTNIFKSNLLNNGQRICLKETEVVYWCVNVE